MSDHGGAPTKAGRDALYPQSACHNVLLARGRCVSATRVNGAACALPHLLQASLRPSPPIWCSRASASSRWASLGWPLTAAAASSQTRPARCGGRLSRAGRGGRQAGRQAQLAWAGRTGGSAAAVAERSAEVHRRLDVAV